MHTLNHPPRARGQVRPTAAQIILLTLMLVGTALLAANWHLHRSLSDPTGGARTSQIVTRSTGG